MKTVISPRLYLQATTAGSEPNLLKNDLVYKCTNPNLVQGYLSLPAMFLFRCELNFLLGARLFFKIIVSYVSPLIKHTRETVSDSDLLL